ncbi:DUF2818 family protein [Roseateles sp. BYS180W]|uniref:DUF2818 family protein n=1 Tax=Roseateles rivi TaxID=3299028 RepID=A0ABW7FZB5_9BURK
MELSVWLVLALALAAANAPYLSSRLFLVGPRRSPKSGWVVVAELLLLALATLVLGWVLEASQGQRHEQGWEFYVAALCLFLTLGFPGFVWRYLRRGASGPDQQAEGV